MSNVTSIEITNVQAILYVQTVLGFCITAAKSLSSLLNLEQRSISMKQISIQLRRISRAVKLLKMVTLPVDEYLKKMDEYNMLIDELDINMFGELTSQTLETTNRQVENIIKENDKVDVKETNDVVISMNNVV